jgi:hypothetical protein
MNNQFKPIEEDGNFTRGLMWGCVLSIPLWLSFFGGLKILTNHAF